MPSSPNQQITYTEGYQTLLKVLSNYHEMSDSDDYTDILCAGKFSLNAPPIDPFYWRLWLKTIESVADETSYEISLAADEVLITSRQGYDAMSRMLDRLFDEKKPISIQWVLENGMLSGHQSTKNPIFWYYWQEAVESLTTGTSL